MSKCFSSGNCSKAWVWENSGRWCEGGEWDRLLSISIRQTYQSRFTIQSKSFFFCSWNRSKKRLKCVLLEGTIFLLYFHSKEKYYFSILLSTSSTIDPRGNRRLSVNRKLTPGFDYNSLSSCIFSIPTEITRNPWHWSWFQL